MMEQAVSKQQNLYALFSTDLATKYLIEEFFGKISFEDGDWIDVHDKRVMTMLKLPRNNTLVYNAGMPVTSNSYYVYRSTSLWWLIVACSDYIHPHQIPNNAKIQIPSFDDISTAFKELYTGLRNQVITF